MSGLFLSIGAGPGMGASTAARFAREGFDVALAARNSDKLQTTTERIREETGRKAEALPVDASDSTSLKQLADKLGGGVSVLHYNAAAKQRTNVFETPIGTMIGNLSVDIVGALAAVKYFAPFMEKQRKGTILLTGGGFALAPDAEYLTLSIGKAGIRCMARALFPELSARGIHIATLTVNRMVNPGSKDADAAADAFWNLHSQAPGHWTWEAVL